jgi:general secretion pathway protein I
LNQSQNSQAGFTLVEIVAAMAILTLSLSALFGVLSDGLGRASQAETHARATTLAQSLLAQVGTEIAVRQGTTTGELADGFRWRLQVEAHGDAADTRAWPIAAYGVSAEVLWGAGAQERSVVLKTLRIVPREHGR